jgi:DNA-binding transcriptional regulator GbsR (MarR family)
MREETKMTEEIKDVNSKIDDLEAAKKKYASADTVISIGGYEFTPAKLMVAFTLVSSILGGLYGVFEVYKDYTGMKKRIAEYVAPDLSELYTQDIKNDLKQDIRRLEGTVESVERSSKQSQRETDISVKEVQSELRQTRKELDVAIKDTNANVDKKIQRALDNPLAGK